MKYLTKSKEFYTYIRKSGWDLFDSSFNEYGKALYQYDQSLFIDSENNIVMNPIGLYEIVELNIKVYFDCKGDMCPSDSIFDTKNGDIVWCTDARNILYENLYMFHDSKAACIWLLCNDMDFFRNLMFEYGFDKDKDVNKRIMDERLKAQSNEYDDVLPDRASASNGLFYTFDEDKHLRIHKNLWHQIYELTDSAISYYEEDHKRALKIKYFEMLSNYMQRYAPDDLTARAELYCNFARMEVDLNKKHSHEDKNGYFNMESVSTSHVLLREEELEEAKKHNYFGIENFDEVLKLLQWDEIHDPQGDNTKYEPFDYSTL